jgi:hypothetical protein
VREFGLCHAAGNAAQGGVVKHRVTALDGPIAGETVANVALEERNVVTNVGEVVHLARGQIVQHDDLVPLGQQEPRQIAPDESRPARDEKFRHESSFNGLFVLDDHAQRLL